MGFARDQRGWRAFGQFGLRRPSRIVGGYSGFSVLFQHIGNSTPGGAPERIAATTGLALVLVVGEADRRRLKKRDG